MANEFIVKNGLIVGGNVVTSGTITINGALAATQSWVSSQAYLTSANLSGYATQSYVTSAIASLVDSAPATLDTLKELATALGNDASFATTITNSIASKLSLSGGTMTGQILFQTSALNNGFRWDVNSDAAGITFKNTGDGDNNSYFNFFTEDNGNEYFKFSHNTWNIGSFDFMDVKNGVIRTNGDIYVNASQSGSRSAGTNELINGSRVWHSGDFSSTNVSNWNTAYSWGNHASAGYLTSVTNISGYSGTLLREDNRTISPSELAAGQLKFGFTSWTNDNSGPYADFLHLRSYTDASGGDDNLVMFKKSGIGMRIWQQTWGSSTPYSSYADVWTTGNFTQTNVNNWNTAYGWGNHASAGYVSTSGSYANPSWITSLAYSKLTGVPAFLTAESDTLNSVTGRGNTTGNAITAGGLNSTADYSLQVDSGSVNVRMGRFKFIRSTYNPTGVSASIDFWRGGSAYEGMLAFSTNGGTIGDTSVERMRITDTGNVGIGTTSPVEKLSLAGSTGTTFGLSLEPSGWNNAKHRFSVPISGDISMWSFNWNGTAVDSALYAPASILMAQGTITFNTIGSATTPSSRMIINSAGNVLIGTTTDNGSKLQVKGNARFNYSDDYGYFGLGYISGADYGIYNYNYGRTDLLIQQSTGNATFSSSVTASSYYTSNGGFFGWGDSSTRVDGDSSNQYIRAVINNSEKLRINPAGNLGIGTISPSAKLHVNGTFISNALWTNSSSIAFWGAHDTAYGGLTWDTGQATVYATSGNKLYLASNGSSPDMTIDTAGNVGIGITAPASNERFSVNAAEGIWALSAYRSGVQIGGIHVNNSILNVQGSGGTEVRLSTSGNATWNGDILATRAWVGAQGYLTSVSDVWVNTTGDTMTGSLAFADNADDVRLYKSSNWLNLRDNWNNIHLRNNISGYGIYSDATVHYWRPHDGSNNYMILSSTGLGIGTSSPGYRLEVNGNVWIENNLFFQNGGGGNAAIYGSTVDGVFRIKNNNIYVPRIEFLDSSSNVMLALNNSNVGIGTTSPTNRLDVIGTSYFSTDMYVGQNHGIFFNGNGGYAMGLYSSGADLIFQASGVEKMRLTSGGSLGIGTTNPTQKLEVAGYGLFQNGVVGSSGLTFYGDNSSPTGMFLTTSGNLGIGTTTPFTKLDVSGVITATGGNSTNWNTAYSWGNHASAGYQSASTAITTSNIGSQSVSYASTAGSANSVSWTNVSGRPTNVSSFTNDSGYYVNGTANTVNAFAVGYSTTNYDFTLAPRQSIGAMSIKLWDNYFNGSGLGVDYGSLLDIYGRAGHVHSQFYMDASGGMWYRMASYSSGWSAWEKFITSNNYTTYTATAAQGTKADTAYSWGNHASAGYQAAATAITTSNIGSQSVSYASSAGSATNSTNTYRGIIEDTRAVERTPNDYEDYKVSWEFTNQISGLNYSGSSWWSAMTMQGWHNGYSAWQIIGSASSAIDDFYFRAGNNTTWNTARRIWHSGDFTSSNVSNWNTAYGWGNHASQSYATTSYVTTQINNLVNGAPGALDTLSELATALGNDASFATTVTNSIAGKVSKSGDTITGNLNVVGNIYSTTSLGVILNAADAPLITRGWDSFTSGAYNGIGRWGLFMEPSTLVLGTPNIAGNGQVAFRRFNADGTSTTTLMVNSVGTTIYGNLTVSGTITENSSIKLKENVETSEGNLEKVVNLRPVSYNKIGSQTKELGLIAEEVAQVYPEFVQYDENGEPIGVNYSRLTAALIGAVKQLTKRIETLENNG